MPNEQSDREEGLLAIGRLGSPFGVRGFLRVRSYSGETGHFRDLSEVLLAKGPERVRHRVQEVVVKGREACVLLEGCSGPEDAARWTGWEILVPRSRAAPLGPGEYYADDLVGCSLVLRGRSVGSVLAVVEGGGGFLLEVRLGEGRTVLVPFRKEFVGNVDTEARILELLEEWILE